MSRKSRFEPPATRSIPAAFAVALNLLAFSGSLLYMLSL